MRTLYALLRWGAPLALIVSLAFAGPQTYRHMSGEIALSAPVPEPRLAATPSEVDIAPVLAFAPFGRLPPAVSAAAPDPGPPLVLTLFGVMKRGQADRSLAMIEHAGETQSYRIGDMVAEVAVVTEVRQKAVVLEVAGVRRVLGFDSFELAEAGAEKPTLENGLDRLSAALDLAERPPLVPEVEETPPKTVAEYTAFWRKRIRANPGQVLDAIGFEAVDSGYRVAAGHDRGLAMAGLQEGDIIRRVNGRTIGNVVVDRKLFDQVIADGVARVEVERGGQVISMSFPIP